MKTIKQLVQAALHGLHFYFLPAGCHSLAGDYPQKHWWACVVHRGTGYVGVGFEASAADLVGSHRTKDCSAAHTPGCA